MNDSIIRDELEILLRGGKAHVALERALEGMNPVLRGLRPIGEMLPSVWEVLEHMRIAQEDILCYTLDPQWQSPKWPEGYWPEEQEEITEEMWGKTVEGFSKDLEQVIGIVRDESLDLGSAIPYTHGHTYMREVLLVADHNAYHTGQIIQIRKLLDDWK